MIGDVVLVDFIGEVQIFSDALSFARLASVFLACVFLPRTRRSDTFTSFGFFVLCLLCPRRKDRAQAMLCSVKTVHVGMNKPCTRLAGAEVAPLHLHTVHSVSRPR